MREEFFRAHSRDSREKTDPGRGLPQQPDNAIDQPIHGEGFSNVIGEAMACGVPCVVTDVGHSAGILGNEGIVVPPGDSNKLADGLNNMLMKLDDIKPHLLRERIKSCFGIETMVESTERALIEVYGSFN